jgi:hypothetical protein
MGLHLSTWFHNERKLMTGDRRPIEMGRETVTVLCFDKLKTRSHEQKVAETICVYTPDAKLHIKPSKENECIPHHTEYGLSPQLLQPVKASPRSELSPNDIYGPPCEWNTPETQFAFEIRLATTLKRIYQATSPTEHTWILMQPTVLATYRKLQKKAQDDGDQQIFPWFASNVNIFQVDLLKTSTR